MKVLSDIRMEETSKGKHEPSYAEIQNILKGSDPSRGVKGANRLPYGKQNPALELKIKGNLSVISMCFYTDVAPGSAFRFLQY